MWLPINQPFGPFLIREIRVHPRPNQLKLLVFIIFRTLWTQKAPISDLTAVYSAASALFGKHRAMGPSASRSVSTNVRQTRPFVFTHLRAFYFVSPSVAHRSQNHRGMGQVFVARVFDALRRDPRLFVFGLKGGDQHRPSRSHKRLDGIHYAQSDIPWRGGA